MELWAPVITTGGALVGSFGGYMLAAESQRRAESRKDIRDRQQAKENRAIQLEDERHDFQLKTLLALQDILRLKARSTFLVIDADRKAIERHGEFKLLPEDLDVDAFESSVEFHQNIARVTNDSLRGALESFYSLCTQFTLPPSDNVRLTMDKSLAIQDSRFRKLAEESDSVTIILGLHLRAELDRNSASRSKDT